MKVKTQPVVGLLNFLWLVGPLAPASMVASLLIPDRLPLIAVAINTALAQCFYHCRLRWRLETWTRSLEVLYLDITSLVVLAKLLRRTAQPVEDCSRLSACLILY